MSNLHLSGTLFKFSVAIHNDVLAEKNIVPFIEDFSANLLQQDTTLKKALWWKKKAVLTFFVNQREWVTQMVDKKRNKGDKKKIFSHQRSTRGPGKMAVATQP